MSFVDFSASLRNKRHRNEYPANKDILHQRYVVLIRMREERKKKLMAWFMVSIMVLVVVVVATAWLVDNLF